MRTQGHIAWDQASLLKKDADINNSFIEKTTLASDDLIVIEDSADSYSKKKVKTSILQKDLARLVTVAKSGGDYDTIQGAIDSITDNSSSIRYIILISPGRYSENVVMEEYVSLVGYDKTSTEIYVTSGIPITCPSGGGEVGISNLKITNAFTGDQEYCIYSSAGTVHVDNLIIDCASSTASVRSGFIDINNTVMHVTQTNMTYTYSANTAGSKVHTMIALDGTAVYHMHDCQFDVTMDDATDWIFGIDETSGSTAVSHISNSEANITFTDAAWTGFCIVLYANGTSQTKSFNGNIVTVECSSGLGSGWLVFLDTGTDDGVLNARNNKSSITGFGVNYGLRVGTGDTFNSYFNETTAADGNDPASAGTINVVYTDSPGTLTASGQITSATDIVAVSTVSGANVLPSAILRLPIDTSDTTEANIRYSSTDDEPQYYDGSAWHYMGSPKQIIATETSVAEGNNSVTGIADKYLIKYVRIETSSTSWDMTIYTKDDYSTKPLQVVDERDGDFMVYLDLPWVDEDSSSEFHYNFTDNSGSNTHDVTFYGLEMK